jgi:sRNA-binding protein
MDAKTPETLEVLAQRWLAEQYPRVFSYTYRPLMIGVHRLIIDRPDRPFNVKTIRNAIRLRTQHAKYLHALIAKEAKRYNLKGKPVALVTREEAREARAVLASRRSRRSVTAPSRV